jgi:putative ABC transport system ATP-binding protein
MPEPVLQIIDVYKDYRRGSETIHVLRGVNLEVAEGDFLGLMGPSGSGKSTLLNLIAGLDQPTSGQVIVGGVEISRLGEADVTRWRSRQIGFVFQFYHLIPVLTAYENVELPLLLFNLPPARRREQVTTVLELVGLKDRMKHRPGQLSGGEQQRVGIARALVTDPAVVVADEPTGDLDSETSDDILDLLEALHERLGKTIILVTHDPRAAKRSRRLIRLEKGALVPKVDGVPADVSHVQCLITND